MRHGEPSKLLTALNPVRVHSAEWYGFPPQRTTIQPTQTTNVFLCPGAEPLLKIHFSLVDKSHAHCRNLYHLDESIEATCTTSYKVLYYEHSRYHESLTKQRESLQGTPWTVTGSCGTSNNVVTVHRKLIRINGIIVARITAIALKSIH